MVRQMASAAGKELRSADSQNGSCVLKTYTRRYSAVGLAGRIASLFGSSYYYRVYSRDGQLLATSEWILWEREYGIWMLTGSIELRCTPAKTAGRVGGWRNATDKSAGYCVFV